MSHKVRKVPKDWVHPKMSNGQYQPMFDKEFSVAVAEWKAEEALWLKGVHPQQIEYAGKAIIDCTWEEWHRPLPEPRYYHTYSGAECTHLQLYEDCTEGTPITPVFATLEEIIDYATDNCTTFADFTATKEQWRNMLEGGFVHARVGNVIFM